MKRTTMTCVAVVLLGISLGGWAWGDLTGSKHDFSTEEWTGGDACAACHGPDRAEPPPAAPLWDATADLNRVFGVPLSGEAKAGNATLVCLRCHDGTVAKDSVSDQAKDRFANIQHPGRFQAGHQRSDHPVGVEYPQFEKGYRPITSVISTGKVPLPDGKVECTSCHDPHNDSGEKHMLVMSNARSALCLTCHKK